MIEIDAIFYDGTSSKGYKSKVEFYDDKRVVIYPENLEKIEVSFDDLKISSRIGNIHRVIQIDEKRVLHSEENDKIDKIIKQISGESSILHLLESNHKLVLLSFITMLLAIVFSLTIGADMSAKFLANIAPDSLKRVISNNSMKIIDGYILKDSNLTKEEKQRVWRIFASVVDKSDDYYELHFRRGMGVNAFALPSGDIYVLDDLVKFCKDDDDMLFGILAHERGHVVKNHSMQILVKSSIVGAVVAYFTGDFSTTVSSLSAGFLNATFSREYEKEADFYAKDLMLKRGKDPKHLAKFFELMSKKYGDEAKEAGFLSSHPADSERIKYLLEK